MTLQSVRAWKEALESDMCVGTGVHSVSPALPPGHRSCALVSEPLGKTGSDAALCTFSASQIMLAKPQVDC